jgi:hypothetical protein
VTICTVATISRVPLSRKSGAVHLAAFFDSLLAPHRV